MRKAIVLGAALLACVVACSSNAASHTSNTPTSTAPSNSTSSAKALPTFSMDELAQRNRVAVVKLRGSPDWQLAAFGSLWLANDDLGQVQRVDTKTNKLVASVVVANPCAGMAAEAGSVWVADCDRHEMVRIAPATGHVVARVPAVVADSEAYIAAGGGRVWFVGERGKLTAIDPATNRVSTTINVPVGSVAVAFGFKSLWVSDPEDDMVVRVDAARAKITARIHVGAKPRFLAAGEGAVWVLNQLSGDVSRIDPADGSVRSIDAMSPGEGGCIATGFGAVWVTIPGAPVTRIDATAGRVTAQYQGEGGDCIGTGAGAVWLSNLDAGTVWRIRPLR